MIRRGILTGLIAAPFVARLGVLMPVRRVTLPGVTFWLSPDGWLAAPMGHRPKLVLPSATMLPIVWKPAYPWLSV